MDKDLEGRMHAARAQRDRFFERAEAEFEDAKRRAEEAHKEALVRVGPLEREIERLRSQVELARGEAHIARDAILGPARRVRRNRRVNTAREYEEECARLRRAQETRLQIARTKLRRSGYRLEEIDGAGECLVVRETGVVDFGNGLEPVDDVLVIGLVTGAFIMALERSFGASTPHPIHDEEGRDWWQWELGGFVYDPLSLGELLDGDAAHPLPGRYSEWVRHRTLEVVAAGDAGDELLDEWLNNPALHLGGPDR